MLYRRCAIYLSLSTLFVLSACKLVDQRTFNPSAGRRPIPYVPPAPPAPPAPKPPIEIVQGTPPKEWAKPLSTLVKDALSRKSDAMFIITAVTPVSQNPAEQQQQMTKTIQEDGQAVAQAILKAGAKPEQIQLSAKADGSVQQNMIQVEIR